MSKKLNKGLPFHLLGYYSDFINLKRTQGSELSEVIISIDSVDFDKVKNICSIGVDIKIQYNDSKDNVISYVSGFMINDEKLISNITSYIDRKETIELENNSEINQSVSIMVASVFPYIRQHVYTITSDTDKPIKLPIIDVRYIDISKSISLKKNK